MVHLNKPYNAANLRKLLSRVRAELADVRCRMKDHERHIDVAVRLDTAIIALDAAYNAVENQS